MPELIKTQVKLVTLIVLVLAVYWPATANGYVWDDDVHVGAAEKIYGSNLVDGLSKVWLRPRETLDDHAQYYPLLLTSYLIEYHLWGMDPFGYHLVNILLHALVACLVWRVLWHLRVPWPYAVGLIFALHPVHVESVAWVSERKNVLSGAFYLLSMLLMLKWRDRFSHLDRCWGLYAASLVLFLCALLSKTVTATLPFVLILLFWWRRQLNMRSTLMLIPFFATGIVMGCITVMIESGHAGAFGKPWDFNLLERFLIAGRALCFYVEKLLIPHDLSFIYPRWVIDSSDFRQYLFPMAVLAFIGGLWGLRHQYGRGPFVGVLIFCGTLFPALGFVNVYPMLFSFVADHFQYLASISMIAMIVATLHLLTPPLWHRWLLVPLVGGLAVFTMISRELQAQYRDETTLWRSTITRNPQAWLAHSNLGTLAHHAKRYPEALQSLTTAAELNPDHIITFNNLGMLYLDLARLRDDDSFVDDAFRCATHAIRLGEVERKEFQRLSRRRGAPLDHLASYQVLGDVFRHQRKYDEALEQYVNILELSPQNLTGLNRIGGLLILRGDYETAIKYLEKSLSIESGQATALTNLGTALYQLKRHQEAKKSLTDATRLTTPMNSVVPWYYLGMLAKEAGEELQAQEHFMHVVKAAPSHELAQRARGELLDMKESVSRP